VIGTIDRLLFRDVFKALGVILGVLLTILLANYLVRLLGQVASGSIGQDTLFAVVGLEMLRAVGRVIPPAFFFSILWVLGRMYQDSEVIALESAGIGPLRIYRAFFIAAIPLALGVTGLVMEVLPWAKAEVQRIKAEEQASLEISGLKPKRFNEFSRGELVFYAEAVADDGALQGVFVQHRQHGKLGVVSAGRALQRTNSETGAKYVVLQHGTRYDGEPGVSDFSIGRFSEYGIKVPSAPPSTQLTSVSSRSWQDLFRSDGLRERTELQYRLSFPLAVFAFVIVSVPLARSLPREGIYGRLILAVLVYIIFMNLQRTAERWMEAGVTPDWLGMWWVPLSMVLVAALVLFWDSMWFATRRKRASSQDSNVA